MVEYRKTNPNEWHRLNRAAMKEVHLRPNLRINRLLEVHLEEICTNFLDQLLSPGSASRFPSYQNVARDVLEWRFMILLRHLQSSIRTRDRGLLKRRTVTHGCFVRATESRKQLDEILDRLHLHRLARPFTRCIRCNARIEDVDKGDVTNKLEPDTARYYDRFLRCSGCGRVYWEGSHFNRMKTFVEHVLNTARRDDDHGAP